MQRSVAGVTALNFSKCLWPPLAEVRQSNKKYLEAEREMNSG